MVKEIYFEDVNIGDEITPLVKEPIPKVQMVKYAGASGDFHPAHTDQELGKSMGMGGVFAHGMLIMGFVGEAITSWIPKKYLRKFGVKFVGVTMPGNVITVSGKVIDKDVEKGLITCDVLAKDQEGQLKIKGNFVVELPAKG